MLAISRFQSAIPFLGMLILMGCATSGSAGKYGDLTGKWKGKYTYEDSEKVAFDFEIKQSGRNFSGSMNEANTFGAESAKFPKADVTGTLDDNHVHFRKVYETQNGQKHTVQYDGTFYPKTRSMSGTWMIHGGHSGTFSAIQQ